NASVLSVTVSGDGRTALSGGHDRTVRVWDLGTGRCAAVLEGHTAWVSSVAVSGDGRTAVSGGADGAVWGWDLGDGKGRSIFPCDEPVTSIAMTPRPPWIVVAGSPAGNVLFFRMETGTCAGSGPLPHGH